MTDPFQHIFILYVTDCKSMVGCQLTAIARKKSDVLTRWYAWLHCLHKHMHGKPGSSLQLSLLTTPASYMAKLSSCTAKLDHFATSAGQRWVLAIATWQKTSAGQLVFGMRYIYLSSIFCCGTYTKHALCMHYACRGLSLSKHAHLSPPNSGDQLL